MNKKMGILAAVCLTGMGIGLLLLSAQGKMTVIVDGQPQVVEANGWTVGQVLRDAGIEFNNQDRVLPAPGRILLNVGLIRVDHARPVQVRSSRQAESITFVSSTRIAGNLLARAGIRFFPGDRLYWNGRQISSSDMLPPAVTYDLEFKPGTAIILDVDGNRRVIFSAAATLGEALWENGVTLEAADRLTPGMDSPLEPDMTAVVQRARPLTIQVGEQQVNARTAAATVGEALAQVGVALQGSDYSRPAAGEPLPDEGRIEVVRVREDVIISQTSVAFENEYVEDPETELDQRSVIEPGQYGIQAKRQRVVYENGKEVSRTTEAEWTASQPKTQKVGYGTKVVIRTLDTPGGTIEYWRAVDVYATSYSPCRSAADRCYPSTSLGLPVKRGVIGVSKQWYNLLAGQPVYVPGYGQAVIADVGGGLSGKKWIDLGFTDDEFEAWHQNVTLYFLTPVPANVPWILP
jgi:uncharacterized protein YabE (DUF348 family)